MPRLERPAAGDRKSKLLFELAVRLRSSSDAWYGGDHVGEHERKLAAFGADAGPVPRFHALANLGAARLRHGDVEGAIASYTEAFEIAQRAKDELAQSRIVRQLAICWMRLGERQNCVGRHNADSCLFPLKGQAIHVDRQGSTRALQLVMQLLNRNANDLEAIWLLNVLHMTLGTWPDEVPPQWRISRERLASEAELPAMRNVALQNGFRDFSRSGAAVMDDFDGDGVMEVVTTTIDPESHLRFWKRQSDGTFADVAAQVGLAGQLGGLQAIQLDADGDGRLDLLVLRGAWSQSAAGEMPCSLLMQQPDGTFLDRTSEAGIELFGPTQVAAVADLENDGDLDLFIGYESDRSTQPPRHPSRLYRNKGDGTFEDVTERAGVANGFVCKGAAFGDVDGDRLPDLYVSNFGAFNRLYRNGGDGTFTDVALEWGVADPHDSFACWFFDQDNDGRLDLFCACYNSQDRGREMAGFYKNGASGTDTMRLYRNTGRGFRDVTRESGLSRVAFPMGASFGDVDHDGFQDLYLATGDPEFASLWPNVMLRNDAGRRFQDVTTATNTGNLQKGHGVAFGDLDGDGDQDLFVKMGGAFPDDRAADCLFENPGHGHRWLTVRLRGTKSNRFGVGARIRVRVEREDGEHDVFAFAGMKSSFGGNTLQEEIGLGAATRIVLLEVYWPTSDTTQRFADVPLDRIVRVTEGDDALELPQIVRAPLRSE